MAKPDPNATFNGYTALMLVSGICLFPQFGVTSLLIAASAIYGGACFMGGYTESTPKRRRK